jgi:hypothetical protein
MVHRQPSRLSALQCLNIHLRVKDEIKQTLRAAAQTRRSSALRVLRVLKPQDGAGCENRNRSPTSSVVPVWQAVDASNLLAHRVNINANSHAFMLVIVAHCSCLRGDLLMLLSSSIISQEFP